MDAHRKPAGPFSLDSKFTVEEGPIYLNGMQALVRLMLDQRRADVRSGLNTGGFVCGYPGSPVGNVDQAMLANKSLLDAHHIVHRQGLNEELAATAAFGTQALHDVPGARYDGVFSMWFGKAPGVDRTGDAFHHHNFRGTGRHGGVLAVGGDDPHARSTIFPSDSNAAFYKFFMPLLAPGNIQEVLDLGLHGFALSRASGLWTGFKLVTDVADSTGMAWVAPDRIQPLIPEVLLDGTRFKPTVRMNEAGPPMLETERRLLHGQLEIARRYAALNKLNRIMVQPARVRIGLLTYGKTYYDVRQALNDIGLDERALLEHGIRILKMGMLYPLEPDIVRDFAQGLEEIFVIEDKRPFLEMFTKDLLYGDMARPRVVGKRDERGEQLLPEHGELNADHIARALLKRLPGIAVSPAASERAALLNAKPVAPAVLSTMRMPYFCSGCPHNTGLKLPPDAVVGAGIGCHIMALWMGPKFGSVKGYTQMGGEGAQWVGLAPFTDTSHFFQNLGDGTFAHSGSLAIRFASATKTNVTYKILYNSTVAMTGGQDIQGGMSIHNMVKLLEAESVSRILITSDEPEQFAGGMVGSAQVWHRDRLLEAEKILAGTPGVTALIHVQQCATEKRRLRKRGKLEYRARSAFINQRVCEGCGDCGEKSNCLSVQPIETEFGRKTQIHQSSCNQDLSCIKGDCPSFAVVESAEVRKSGRQVKALPFPTDVQLPEPDLVVPPDRFSVCLTGVGGTGVVTVNQILGTAAFRSGMNVQTYDHTGASQKAGPVVSHLKVFPEGVPGSPTVGTANADLLLAFDELVAVGAANITTASPQRTVAVVSTTEVPTGEMVANKYKHYPQAAQLRAMIDATTRSGQNVFIDAQNIAERLLGDHMASNLLLVGVAYQRGALPIPPDSIEEAIKLNGTAAEMNIQAFRWGRLVVADRARVDTILAKESTAQTEQVTVPDARVKALASRVEGNRELQRVLEVRVAELIEYQDEAYARRYIEKVRTIREAEKATIGEQCDLSIAVARYYFKLLAVKDEYEVARLLLDEGERARLKETFGKGAKIRWLLHPTFLRRLGVKNKVSLGAWFTPALYLLRWAKRLRGTSIDLFALARVRKLEGALRAHYEALLSQLPVKLTMDNYQHLVKLVSLPDAVRGYEEVKARSITQYIVEAKQQTDALGLLWPEIEAFSLLQTEPLLASA